MYIFYTIIFFICLEIVYEILRMLYYGVHSRRQTKSITRFSRESLGDNEKPLGNILCIGDSVMYGSGASKREYTLAAHIAKMFPQHALYNESVLGMKTKEMYRHAKKYEHIPLDYVFIFCGGMDILHFSSLSETVKNIREVCTLLEKNTKHIYYITTPDVGKAPIFFFLFSYVYSLRSRILHDMIYAQLHIMRGVKVHIIDIIKKEDTLKSAFYSKDKSHPNDTGYTIWASIIKQQL